ncbi:hypothetical protein EON65_02410 [archaeon]|nr:MAG: hypothetical protein EON65_02410 [archaeon]
MCLQVASTGRGGKEMSSAWMLPAWLPTSLFGSAESSSPLPRDPAMKPVLEEIRAAGVDNGYMKATASMRSLAGYMDYDPKAAAKSVYQKGYKAGMKREGSWFSM